MMVSGNVVSDMVVSGNVGSTDISPLDSYSVVSNNTSIVVSRDVSPLDTSSGVDIALILTVKYDQASNYNTSKTYLLQ